ncbi:MAG: hypothetical protein ISR67_01590 [Sulfurimonas sp.]|nr:hypothetical protein [Sulfurimonas sp.]
MKAVDKSAQLEKINTIMNKLWEKSSSQMQTNRELEVMLAKFRYLKQMMDKMEVASIENFLQSKSQEIKELLEDKT